MNKIRYDHNPPNQYELHFAEYICKLYRMNISGIIFNDRKQIAPFELDIYIPILKMGFELQGPHHYGNKYSVTRQTDALKKKVCKERGIALRQIPIWYLDCPVAMDLALRGYWHKAMKSYKIIKRKEIE